MNINWRRLLTTLSIVILTSAALGFVTWYGQTKIIQDKEKTIALLANRSNEINQTYRQKLQEKKAADAAAAEADAATKTSTKTTQDVSNTATSDESSSQEETTAQSQILYFYNPSCGACIAQEPIVHQVEAEGIPFVWYDIVANPDYINQYGITATPTFILNGNRRNFSTKTQLESFWNSYK